MRSVIPVSYTHLRKRFVVYRSQFRTGRCFPRRPLPSKFPYYRLLSSGEHIFSIFLCKRMLLPVSYTHLIGCYPGERIPNIVLHDIEGNILDLSKYKGKKVIVNFWATYDEMCIRDSSRRLAGKSLYPTAFPSTLSPAGKRARESV